MALYETSADIARHVAQEKSSSSVEETEQEISSLLREIIQETQTGVSLSMEWYSCVGRKSLA